MKPKNRWLLMRLYLAGKLGASYGLAFLLSRHLHCPIEDALIGVLFFTATWTDTQVTFAQPTRSKETAHALSAPQNFQPVQKLASNR